MPFLQGSSPPPNKIHDFSIDNFTGGLNNVSSYRLLEDNQTSDVMNMIFTEDGVIEKRKGFQLYDVLTLTAPVIYMDVYKPINAPHQLIRATATELYVGNTKICDVSGKPMGINYMGEYYFVDGNKFRVYRNNTVYEIIEPHQTDVVGSYVASATSVTVVNASQFVVGEPMEFHNHDLNTRFTATPTAINYTTNVLTFGTQLGTAITAHAHAHAYVTRGTSFKEGIWYYKPNNTAFYAPCLNELEDEWKGLNVIPSKCKYIIVHEDRIFMSGNPDDPHMVYISDINNGMYFPTVMPMQMTPNGDEIVGLRVFHNAVVVGRREDVHVIYGNTNRLDFQSFFYIRKVNTHTGWANQHSVREVHNFLYYLGSDGGVYSLHTVQTNVDLLATKVMNETVDLFLTPLDIAKSELATSYGYFNDGFYWLSFDTKMLVYSFRFRAWTVFSGINARSFLYFNNEFLVGGSDGKTYKFGYDYNDNGLPITCWFVSKRFDMGHASRVKQFRNMYVVAKTYEEYESELALTFEVDYVDIKDTVSITNQIARWGKAVFGTARFITRNISRSTPIVIGRRGRLIRYIISNDKLNEALKVYEINGEYELRGFR